MIVIHLKKKDIVKSKVRGIEMEFDHEKLATILGVPGTNGICEYIKEVWEESKYTKPLEITRRFANDENIMAARRVKSGELKPFQRFIHFLVMKNVVPGGGENEEEMMMLMHKKERREKEDEGNKDDFDWEAMIDEKGFMMLRMRLKVLQKCKRRFHQTAQRFRLHLRLAKDQEPSGVDPSGLTGREAEFLKFQAEFERKRANRFHDDLEKAKAENARLLALLHQAQTKPHP
ncbi:hypothetical protein Dimus_017818 [Dionaea muscipula]